MTLVSKESAQAENLRKLLVAMSKDPRVLLVKMADRLHNMRTIGALKPEKRERIAHETLEIFAPLAGRMGMQSMREELEDLAFQALHPDARLSIMRRFVHLRHIGEGDFLSETVELLRTVLSEAGVEASVSGREKRPYSIWRKAEAKGLSFEHLSDIVGFRVVVATELECYLALGAIHRRFRAVPDRFKDYISGPKSNGYRSLHTTVIGDSGQRLEMQLRTQIMHEVAETGVAAHWSYKEGVPQNNPFAVDPFHWLRSFVERADFVAKNGGGVDGDATSDFSAEAFMAETKLEMSFDQVFCFTPAGDVIGLPQGATMLDFAYAVHTDVGHTAVGAKSNGRPVPLGAALRNGHTVEILQSSGNRPSPVRLKTVKTGRARAAIRRTIRAQERESAAVLGRRLAEGVFEEAGMPFSLKAIETAATRMGRTSAETLFADIGEGKTLAREAFLAVYPEKAELAEREATPTATDRPQVIARSAGVPNTEAGTCLTMPPAACCSPIPGDRIVALREPGRGFFLHTIDCPALEAFEDQLDRWVDVSWAPSASERAQNTVPVELVLANEPGALGSVCTLIGTSGANIADLVFTDRQVDYFRIEVAVDVRDLRHLNNNLTSLEAQPVVASVSRLRRPPAAHAAASASAGGSEPLKDAKTDQGQERLPNDAALH
ncbi:MAG: RelA/SpoT family protein [Pseudomonadota bacterium]